MTTATPTRPGPSAPPPPPRPSGVAPSLALSPLDPMRLARKYWLVLGAACAVGGVVGLGGHLLLKTFMPSFRASATFQCLAPQSGEVGVLDAATNEDELARFMASQIATMTSDRVLQAATNNPRFPMDADKWSEPFRSGTVFSYQEAALKLKESITARVTPGTDYVVLAMGWRDRNEVASIVRMVREAYTKEIARFGTLSDADQNQALSKAIRDQEDALKVLQSQRENLIQSSSADTLESQKSSYVEQINLVNEKLVETVYLLEAARVELAAKEIELKAGTPQYSDELRDAVERDPVVSTLTRTINDAEGQLTALRDAGFGPDHRSVVEMVSRINGLKTQLESEKARLLDSKFRADLDTVRKGLDKLQAQEKDLLTQQTDIRTKLNELTKVQAQLTDLQARITQAADRKSELETRLDELETRRLTAAADRVRVVQVEQVPTEMSFPKIYILIPAGILLFGAITASLVVVRELFDQRVKGPSDVLMIPRTRVVGLVPHASEDPSEPVSAETAFIDQPKGVIAEGIRQMRAHLQQRMRQAGHRSLLVTGGLPESGVSTVAANLAAAFAMADRRVLLIDANFRRPAQHQIWDLPEGPGLGDVLAGNAAVPSASRPTSLGALSVLTAGTPESRRFERLASDRMTELLAEAARAYDVVLVDAPPMVVSGDAPALASRCDSSVLVVRAYSEKRGMVNRLRNELADQKAEFLGVIVNAVRSAAGGYFRSNIRATHAYQQPAARA